jgi:hydrogenase expression/formation protein HypC
VCGPGEVADAAPEAATRQNAPKEPELNVMCLAVPGRVLTIDGLDPAFRTGTVDFQGVRRVVNLAFTPEVVLGDFVLVHVGFALTRIDEEEAARTFQYLAQIGALAEEGLAPATAASSSPPS